jgi:hypothetical protein
MLVRDYVVKNNSELLAYDVGSTPDVDSYGHTQDAQGQGQKSVRRRESGVDQASPSSSSAQPGLTEEFKPELAGFDRNVSSYRTVSETTDFPGLLRVFSTDWTKIADHMQTKTATMVYYPPVPESPVLPTSHLDQVENYYVRQTEVGGKPEWEQIAMKAEAKGQRFDTRGEESDAKSSTTTTKSQHPRHDNYIEPLGHDAPRPQAPAPTLSSQLYPAYPASTTLTAYSSALDYFSWGKPLADIAP